MYLIQRCRIISDNKTPTMVKELLRHDYMGSAEFEYGALPKSLREIFNEIEKFQIFKMGVPGRKTPLGVFCRPRDYADIASDISKIVSGDRSLRLKERTFLEPGSLRDELGIDMWWCIDAIREGTPCFFTWNAYAINRIKECILGSVRFMDAQKVLQR